ncbi:MULTISPECIES: SusC/RagA family TonB-linked outer membrane protein [unclassified Sphingobacterium]|uniref:SusC/RagA family TonB-linked outer membrane protein n=1 Tax=unclassified Sphingobacterium TaxID=2609468 RepID=UPI0010471D1E|nr:MULTISPECIES: SusC/RagA family TonB-linked outer membrane protein [unclassified Sphingobacterium]MCS3556792.1 TonB-linked SusC/RagA family outer membrane protein [Sphingobacterium sp. JUb21]TCQ99282.1 TonB-linked SusC/RagA family outer membrane protein [Sphingobacterium sp. JUb20]
MKQITLLWILALITSLASAQQKINIIVLDSLTQKPIAHVNIKNGLHETVGQTGENGSVLIPVEMARGNLQCSRVGYEPSIIAALSIDGREQIIIRLLPKSIEMEEVQVNTGYHFLPKERSTGAYSIVTEKQLQERIAPNILDRLEGIAPGLQFDKRSGNSVMNIRGINSFGSGGIAPLIIVDNFPYTGEISNINPNDVESVNLLKDAAATSIWGARAGNGVLVINMKKPKARNELSFTANTSFTAKPDLRYLQEMSSTDFIAAERLLYDKGFYKPSLTGTNARLFVMSPVVTLLNQVDQKLITVAEAEEKIRSFEGLDYRDDYEKYFYRTGVNQQYNLSTGANMGALGYRVSASYDSNKGNMVGEKSERLTLTSSVKYEPNRMFRFELNSSYNNNGRMASLGVPNYPLNVGGGKASLYPYAQLADAHGNPLIIPYQYNAAFVDTVGGGRLLDWHYAPLTDISKSRSTMNNRYLSFSPTVQIRPMDGVMFALMYNYEHQANRIFGEYDVESFYVRNMVNRYTQIVGGIPRYNLPKGAIANVSNNILASHKFRIQGNVDKIIALDHQINALLGAEVTNNMTSGESRRLYGYDGIRLTQSPIDYLTRFPIYGGLASAATIPFTDGFSKGLNRFISAYMNVGYTYKSRYVLSFSTRRDASNYFGVNTNNRWKPLWSAGAAWNLQQEKWLENSDFVNALKLRMTYGHSGNSTGQVFTDVILQYATAPDTYYGKQYARIISPPNTNLKWEDVAQLNVGVDFGFFRNRLSGSVDLYRKHTTDLISTDPIDPTVGFASINRNVASIKGRGIDLQLNALILNKGFKWNSSFFVSYTKDKVEKFKGNKYTGLNYASSGGRSISPIVGYVMYPVFSYRFKGLDPKNGNPLGFTADGPSDNYSQLLKDSVEQLVYHGSGLPLGHGAWTNSFSWKGVEFSWTLSFKFSSYFMKPTIRYMDLMNNWTTHADFANRWQHIGDELTTTVPSFSYPGNQNRDNFYSYSSANVEKGELLRIQNVRLGYTVQDQKMLERLRLKRATLYVTANNLGLLWSATKSGYDPDFTYLPNARTINCGINILF